MVSPPLAALLAVLRDRFLLSHIARFQRGLPLYFVTLRNDYVVTVAPFLQTRNPGQRLWEVVLRGCDLRLVQKLYYLRSLPEYEGSKEVHMNDLTKFIGCMGRLDVLVIRALDRGLRPRATTLFWLIIVSTWHDGTCGTGWRRAQSGQRIASEPSREEVIWGIDRVVWYRDDG